MTPDLEQRLSARLHAEAAHLVPETAVPPLPASGRRGLLRIWGRCGTRWRAPLLTAIAVLVVAITATVVVQSLRDHPSTAAAPQASPVHSSPGAPFTCDSEITLHAAQAGPYLIGITDRLLCLSNGNNQISGGGLQGTGPLRSLSYTESVATGAVDTTVDRVVWVPRGTAERSGTTIDLYSLGALNGFAFPISTSGTVLIYTGTTVADREDITLPGDAPPAASSPATAESSAPKSPDLATTGGSKQPLPSSAEGTG